MWDTCTTSTHPEPPVQVCGPPFCDPEHKQGHTVELLSATDGESEPSRPPGQLHVVVPLLRGPLEGGVFVGVLVASLGRGGRARESKKGRKNEHPRTTARPGRAGQGI